MRTNNRKPVGLAGLHDYRKMWDELRTQVRGLLELEAGCEQTEEEKHDDETFNIALRGILRMMDEIEEL